MEERKTSNQKVLKHTDSQLTQLGRGVESKTQRKGYRAWLFGAYTFLFVWGMAYLVLLFTNRLPS